MSETDTDLRFYIDLYVDCWFTYDEAELMAKKLLAMAGVTFDEDN